MKWTSSMIHNSAVRGRLFRAGSVSDGEKAVADAPAPNGESMTVNIAFYGAGEPARPYLDALAQRSDVQLVGICDLDRRAAEQIAAGWGARVFLSPEAMLQEANPDALWVCVRPSLLGEVLLKAAEKRVPFFVQPPGALDHAHAQQCGQRVREAN